MKNKLWTDEEVAIILDGNHTIQELAVLLDRTPSSISCKKFKLRHPDTYRYPIQYERQWCKTYRQKGRKDITHNHQKWQSVEDDIIMNSVLPDRVIAESLGRSAMAVAQRRYKLRAKEG